VFGLGLWPLGCSISNALVRRKLGLASVAQCRHRCVAHSPLLVLGHLPRWRHAVLALALLVLFVSWPLVAYCLREPSAADVAARKLTAAGKAFGLSFRDATREPTFVVLSLGFFLLGVTATSLVSQQVPLLRDAGWTADETTRLQTTFGFGLLFARVAVGYIIDHIFAPRVLTTVSIGGAFACILYAVYPDAGYVSALLIGFLLGAEFDVLAFLIKRYYGNAAYATSAAWSSRCSRRLGIGIWPPKLRAVRRFELRQWPLRCGGHTRRLGVPHGVHAAVPLRRRPRGPTRANHVARNATRLALPETYR
jgi:MFS family permease